MEIQKVAKRIKLIYYLIQGNFQEDTAKVVEANGNEAFRFSRAVSLYTFVVPSYHVGHLVSHIQLNGYKQLTCQVHRVLSCLPGRPCMNRRCSVALLLLMTKGL